MTKHDDTDTDTDTAVAAAYPAQQDDDPLRGLHLAAQRQLQAAEDALSDLLVERDAINARIKELRPEVQRLKVVERSFTPRTRTTK